MRLFEAKYQNNRKVYNVLGIKFKIKIKPKNIKELNLIFSPKAGIGNRINGLVSCINVYSPEVINLYWDKSKWVTAGFFDLFKTNFPFSLNEYDYSELSGVNECSNERSMAIDQIPDFVETKDKKKLIPYNNLLPEEIEEVAGIFDGIKPADIILQRINGISLPDDFVSLQVRNNQDWDEWGRTENLELFIDEINKYPKGTTFYLSAMNREASDFIKNNAAGYQISELPQKDYSSMSDAVADLYIMSKAKQGIYSFGSTFGELAWWFSDRKQKFTAVGSDNHWAR